MKTMPVHNNHAGLAGKRILVTRPADQSNEIISLLQHAGAEVVLFPTISINPAEDWTACDDALDNLDLWDALIFTSANGVRFFVEHVKEVFPHLIQKLQNCTAYAVGEKTMAVADSFGLPALCFNQAQNAEVLAEELARRVKGKILFPCGNLTGDTVKVRLSDVGVGVTQVVVYQTLPYKPDNTDQVIKELKNKHINAIAFFSPSGIKHFLDLIPQSYVEGCAIAAIGTTTAAAARSLGLFPDIVAETPDSKNLIKTMENYYRDRS
ncbi:uroporphyrinogen-III synthase [bacterium]|nr:MAG: uroporphyrinogen-III synthase [bacterium]